MNQGFSRFEMSIWIVVLLIISVFALVVINPQELIRQGRDVSRMKQVDQIGQALYSYSESKNGAFPYETSNWMSDLTARGTLTSLPDAISYDDPSALCKSAQIRGLCYDTDGKLPATGALIYTKLESVRENTKCNVALGETAWYVYDTVTTSGGIVCTRGVEPSYTVEGQSFKN